MIKAVFFDIDGTLYDYNAAHRIAFGALAEEARARFGWQWSDFLALHRRSDDLLKARCGLKSAAIHNRLIRYQIMLELMERPIGYAPQMERLYWSTLMKSMVPYPGLMETFSALHQRKLVLGIGTNMTADWQFEKLKRLGVLDTIDCMVTSEEAGCEKPDRRLFEMCAEKAGCLPSECAFVGDSLVSDALGAQAAGMLPVWFDPENRSTEVPPGIHHVTELRDTERIIT